jgi:type VI secretion system secreted protein Hcp
MASDMFLKIDNIKGESVDSVHKDQIDILSFSWGVTQSGSSQIGIGTGTGKASVSDLTVSKFVDKASPLLFQMSCLGTPFTSAILYVRKAGGKPLEYIKITMSQGLIASVQESGGGGDERVTETLSLNFASVIYEYVPQNPDGSAAASVTKGFNIAGNVAI